MSRACPSVCFDAYLMNQLIFELEFSHVYES